MPTLLAALSQLVARIRLRDQRLDFCSPLPDVILELVEFLMTILEKPDQLQSPSLTEAPEVHHQVAVVRIVPEIP